MTRNVLNSMLVSLATVSAALWFGATLASQMVAYDLFETGTATLKTVDVTVQMNTIRLSANVSMMAAGAALVMLPAFLLFCIRQRSNFRKNAYLMMCTVLFAVSVPAVVGSIWQSWNLYQSFGDHYSSAGLSAQQMDVIRQMFVTMFTKHAWMNLLGPAGFVSILVVLIVKPLRIESAA